MKRSGIMTGIGFLLLIGGLYFLVFRDSAPEEKQDIFSEESPEEAIDKEGESIELILEDMPKQPDFTSITETIFLNEGVEEAKSFERRAMAPLEKLQSMAGETITLMAKNEVNWCAPLVNASLEGMDNDAYRESLQEEREIRDVKFLSQAVQVGDEWSTWLVRLTEASNREGKKEEKAVENFQEAFNDITDEYEEALYLKALEARAKIDAVIFAEREILLLPDNLVQELNKNLETEMRTCKEGKALSASEQATASRTLTTWETRVKNALEGRKRTMNRVLDVPTAALPVLKPKTQEYTARFEAAIVELQQGLVPI